MSVVLLNHCRRYILLLSVACLCVLLGRSSYTAGAESLIRRTRAHRLDLY